MNSSGRAKYEVVIVVVLVILAVALGFGFYSQKTKLSNGKRMMTELEAVRSAITAYASINRSMPADLTTLARSTYDAGSGAKRSYLEKITTNEKGEPVDVFGKPFVYDKKTGHVVSASVGYERW